MKKTLFTFLLLFAATSMNAQTIVKGDMDGDGEITITDVTGAVDVILGKAPKQTISQVGPYQGTLMFFDTQDKPVKTIVLNEVDKGRYLLAVNYVTDTYTYYYRDEPDVNYPTSIGIDVISGSSTINVGESVTLYARFTPENAEGTVNWTCNNESIVNYSVSDKTVYVTGTAAGTATFTATLNEDTSISNSKTITIRSNDPQPTTYYWYVGTTKPTSLDQCEVVSEYPTEQTYTNNSGAKSHIFVLTNSDKNVIFISPSENSPITQLDVDSITIPGYKIFETAVGTANTKSIKIRIS